MRLDSAYRQEQSKAWLNQARRDCGAVERLLGPKPQHLPDTPEVAVYLLQQSVEKAVKALMVADGKDEKDFPREFRHNSLKVVLDYLARRFALPVFGQTMDTLSRDPVMGLPNAIEALLAFESVKGMLQAGEFRNLAVMPADEMRPVVQLIADLHNAIESGVRGLLASRTRVEVDLDKLSSSSAMDYLWEVVNNLFVYSPALSGEATAVAKALIGNLASEMPERTSEDEELDILINRDSLLSNWIMPHLWTPISLYLLAALTYPHEASSRYPAQYGAPEDPREAFQQGTLGSAHYYTEDLGIVVMLPDIHRWTRVTLDSMTPMLEVAASSTEWPDIP